ncbi:ABC transporter ATP-binding protein [Millisia brevis]|uniref:ABC transporter ATP-binding protein n=1 Tax=Millisia brevis TaxID=264148 RepID=UPI0008333DC3|nr:ABC transporter ATP-binding protein [Millisia brevis]
MRISDSAAIRTAGELDDSGAVRLARLSRRFDGQTGPVDALREVDLSIADGEFVSLIGPSGCGKSTLLKIVAGLDTDFSGTVEVGGRAVRGPGIDRGFIFQESRLFPWLTVEANIAANLSLRDSSVRDRVHDLIRLVRLDGFERAYPKELSGGMAQRVAIARALLRDPAVLLLDEPFGALDAFTRAHMQEVLVDIWTRRRTTMVFVTHDVDEAVVLANRVVILAPRPGRVRSIIPIDLPHPRITSSRELQEYRFDVLTQFESTPRPAERVD